MTNKDGFYNNLDLINEIEKHYVDELEEEGYDYIDSYENQIENLLDYKSDVDSFSKSMFF